MVYATFEEHMLEMLKGLKNSKMISYECAESFHTTYGNVRINTDKGSVEITNLQRTMPFFDTSEDIACFECKKVDASKIFIPYCIEPFHTCPIHENIIDVSIIKDVIDINHGEYAISLDRAVVITTEKRIIMFSRDVWFSEVITISNNDDYNAIFSVNEVMEVWSNEGDNHVSVERSIIKL